MAAYLIVDVDVEDPARYEEYKRAAAKLIERHGGRYLVRGGEFEVIEGEWKPTRLVLLEFPHRRAIREFLNDPEYKPLRELRHQVASSSLVAVDGI